MRTYDKPITIQKINAETEQWGDHWNLHARINKTQNDNEYSNGGAIQVRENLTFEVRYFSALQDIRVNTQSYRILFLGVPYNIESYDDYMMQHKTVKLMGVSY